LALRPVLPGPAYGLNPEVDRPYIAALVTKALAGPAAAAASSSGTAGAGIGEVNVAAAAGVCAEGSSDVAPWSCRAAEAAAAVELQRVLQVCDQLGTPADWVR
jgi:hypothetical protein